LNNSILKKQETILSEVIATFEQGMGILNPKQINSRLVAKGFNIDITTLEKMLNKLVKQERLIKMGRARYKMAFKDVPLTGVMDFTRSGSAYLINEVGDDIFIKKEYVYNALSGDTVAAKLVQGRGKKKEGRVLRVIKRANPEFTAMITVKNERAKVTPRGNGFFPNHQLQVDLKDYKPKDGDLVILRIDDSQSGNRIFAEIKEVLGKAGQNNAEMHAIIAEYGFATKFSDQVEVAANKIDHNISAAEIKQRLDLRNHLTFTIDPLTAKDFDDALSYNETKDGYEIGVHIADVSHYVQEDSAIDQEAAQRATSVYLVDRTIPMLPEVLSNDLCSLKAHVDRLAYGVIFKYSKQEHLIDYKISKVIIHSDRRFTYEEAQEIIEGKADDKFSRAILQCNKMAKTMKVARFENGAINFETPEVRFVLDETGKPIGLETKVRKDAHKMIEEWMLLANRTVARYMHEKGKSKNAPFVYRVHDEPAYEKLVDLKDFAKKFGYSLQIDNIKNVPKEINKLMEAVAGKPEESLLSTLAIRSMAKAVYTTEKTSHFGLAFDHYAHFTSPIRRYPDLLCHRWLFKFMQTTPVIADKNKLEALAKHSSMMEQKASDAERASVKYKQAEFLQDHVGEVFTAIVTGLTDWGIYAEIPQFKAEGMIRLSNVEHGNYYYNEKTKTVFSRKGEQVLQLGESLNVLVVSANPFERKIDLEWVK